jgi:hypothetical protein
MSKRVITYLVATAAAAAMLPVASGMATSSSTASAGAAKIPVVPIVMRDPGCHWFHVAGKDKARLVVHGKTAFRNLDEAAVIFKGKNYVKRVAVGKSLVIAKAGVYHITMVGQHPDDNNLALIVK